MNDFFANKNDNQKGLNNSNQNFINPYLFGILLSNSSFENKNFIRLSVSNGTVMDIVRLMVKDDISITLGESSGFGKWHKLAFVEKGDNKIKNELSSIGLIEMSDEHIFMPNSIKSGGDDVKTSFLLGLLDGDGTYCIQEGDIPGLIKFYTKSKQFYKDIEFLVNSLKGKTSAVHSSGYWDINIYLPFPISLYKENSTEKATIVTMLPKK